MFYVGYAEALKEIERVTRQKSNIFTMMHYISNGYLDVLICGEYNICEVSRHGNYDDDNYYANGIKNKYKGYLSLDLNHLSLDELQETLAKDKRMLEVLSVKEENKPFEYVLLKTCATSSELSMFDSDSSIESGIIAEKLGFGLCFTKESFLFDLRQIERLPYFHPAQNRSGEFYAPELDLVIRIWEKMYLDENGSFNAGISRDKRIEELIIEADVQLIKSTVNTRFKDRVKAIINPKNSVKIKNHHFFE